MAEGRGVDHLSAALEEGDLVLYQTGQWAVDGVAIGALQLFPRSAENDAVAAIGAAANDDGRPRRLTFRYPAAPALPQGLASLEH